jgi:hypothetical protein
MCYQIPGTITKNGQPIIGGIDIDKFDFAFAGSVYPKSVAKGAALHFRHESKRPASKKSKPRK